MSTFELPDLGEGLTEAEIVSWLVTEGEEIAVDQAVVEVETAKASVEVPCPFSGTVTRLHGAEGGVVAVGAPLLTVASGPDTGASPPDERGIRDTRTTVPDARDGSDPAGGNGAADSEAGSGAVLVGYGTAWGTRSKRRGAPRAGGPPGSTATSGGPPTNPAAPLGGSSGVPPTRAGAGTGVEAEPGAGPTRVVSPLVRRLARENGIDITALHGSGEGGLILRRDVEPLIGAPAAGTATGAATGTAAGAATGAFEQEEPSGKEGTTEALGKPWESVEPGEPGTHRSPLRGAHRVMAEHLSRSRREIPEATVWVDVDATGMVDLRRELNDAAPDRPVSVLGLVARFALLGLTRFPELNAHFDTARQETVRFDAVHLGFAAQTPRGLVVPVLREAHTLTTRELSSALGERADAARSGATAPEDLRGGTFTVNNYGVFGVDGSAAIINHPEVAILGVGRILRRPWVVGDDVVPRPITELTLTFDHRVCHGGVAGGFLRWVADCMERPHLLLGDL
ncbi:dihydrolipoamide acetyltransferase family protein [Nocardiopsis nanhaiensis]